MNNKVPSRTMLSWGNITWIFLNDISYLISFSSDGESNPLTHRSNLHLLRQTAILFSMFTHNNNDVIISISLQNNHCIKALFHSFQFSMLYLWIVLLCITNNSLRPNFSFRENNYLENLEKCTRYNILISILIYPQI